MTTATYYVIVACFCVVMTCNVIAFIRHWRMMRALEIVLTGLITAQNQFGEVMAMRDLPEAEREAAIRAMVERWPP